MNHLASDPVANTVFWTRGGSAGGVFGRHVSGAGGTVTYLSATPAWALSLDVNHIAWSTSVDESTASSYTGDAGRTALDSPGSPSVIASGVDHPRAVANAGSNFFWAEFTNGKVYRAPAVGLNVSAPSALAVTADGFWVLNSGGTLYRTNLNYAGGTTPGAVHTSAVAGPTSLALGTLGRKVFFSDGEGLYQYDGETGAELVLTADYEPGAVTKNHVFAIAAHDGWVYYTTNQIGGNARGSRLFRVQMDVEQQTARPVVLAPGQDARGLTVVGDFIYWANVTGSAIMAVRIPLPPGSGE